MSPPSHWRDSKLARQRLSNHLRRTRLALREAKLRCGELAEAHHQAQADLQERIKFESLLGTICARMINLDPREVNHEIDASLHELVEFLGVDRSTLMEWDVETQTLRGTHSWVRPGLQPAPLDYLATLETQPFYCKWLLSGRLLAVYSLDDLPPEAKEAKELAIRAGVKSHVAVPLRVGGEVVGAIGFAYLRHEQPWPADMLARLSMIGEAFANAILRKRWNQQTQAFALALERQVSRRTALAERRAAQLRRLALQLTQAEHRERRRIAGILREGLQQVLVGSQLALAANSARQSAPDAQALDKARRLVEEAIRIARSVGLELSPPVLYELGLPAGLRWLAQHMHNAYGLNVHLQIAEIQEPISDDLAAFLFESARELLTNVVKHAGVLDARLTLEKPHKQYIRLCVFDEGIGMDPRSVDAMQSDSLGLLSLRERMKLLGGRLLLSSGQDRGTTVAMILPLRARRISQ